MIDIDTIIGIAAFSLILPVFVMQLMYNQKSALAAAEAASQSLEANSKLQESMASFASSNLTQGQAEEALRTEFGNDYALGTSAGRTGAALASRVAVIEGRQYYVEVNMDEGADNP